MAKSKRDKPIKIDKEFIEGRKRRIGRELLEENIRWVLNTVYQKKNYALVASNVDSTIRIALLRGMMAYRVEKDLKAAISDFSLACDHCSELSRAVERLRSESSKDVPEAVLYFHVYDFEVPLFVCLLAGNWVRAAELAGLIEAPESIDKETPLFCTMTRLLSAFVREDRARFDELARKFEALPKRQGQEFLAVYVRLYDAVLRRNEAKLDQLLEEAKENFFARATDKKYTSFRPEYGAREENQVVFDFIATAIAKVALKRGMKVNHDSEAIPLEVVKYGVA